MDIGVQTRRHGKNEKSIEIDTQMRIKSGSVSRFLSSK